LLTTIVEAEILSLVNQYEDSTGYTLHQRLKKHYGRKVSYGTIYPIIHRFVKAGFMERTETEHSYRMTLTEKGMTELKAIRAELLSICKIM
jgi:DNA-binding PadR family transcriptional regulator